MEYTINLIWDKEAGVWVATSEDVKGLVLESGSLDALIERVKLQYLSYQNLIKRIFIELIYILNLKDMKRFMYNGRI